MSRFFIVLLFVAFGLSSQTPAQKVGYDRNGVSSYRYITSKQVCRNYSEYYGLTSLVGTVIEKNDEDSGALTVTIRTTRGRKTFNLEVPIDKQGGWFYREVWDDLLSLDSKIRVVVFGCGRLSTYYFAKDIFKLQGKN